MAAISVLLVTKDYDYGKRISNYFGNKHRDIKFSVINDSANVNSVININSCSVVLLDDGFHSENIQEDIAVACISAKQHIAGLGGRKMFCKYKSGEVIYSNIIELYSEVGVISPTNGGNGGIYLFSSVCGGTGTTTAAVAFAKKLAKTGKKVLFFSFDKFSVLSDYFEIKTDIKNMSELIISVISPKNIDIVAKAVSVIQTDHNSGVKFVNTCSRAVDYDELDKEKIDLIYKALCSADNFDAIIMESPAYDRLFWDAASEKADKIISVIENTEKSYHKYIRFMEYVKTCDEGSDRTTGKFQLIFGKNTKHTENANTINGVPFIGSIPLYENSSNDKVINAVSALDMWNNCI